MFRSSSFKYAILAVSASAICGFFHSLPILNAPPTQASLAAAIRGIAWLQKLDGCGTASWIDLTAGRLWRSGGASLLATGQWLAVFAGWTVAALIAFTVVFALVHLLNDPRARGILFGSAVVLTLATCVPPLRETIARRGDRISDLRLVLPAELADQVRALDQAKTFANPSALAHLLLFAPNSAASVSMADSVRLSTNPAQWREEFRRAKWNAVLLSGTLGEYRPLLDHLMGSPDWHLPPLPITVFCSFTVPVFQRVLLMVLSSMLPIWRPQFTLPRSRDITMPFDAPRTLGLASSGRLSSLPIVSPFSHTLPPLPQLTSAGRMPSATVEGRSRETMGRPMQNLFRH